MVAEAIGVCVCVCVRVSKKCEYVGASHFRLWISQLHDCLLANQMK